MKKTLFYILIISTLISLTSVIHIQITQAAGANEYVLLEELPVIDNVGGKTMNLDQYIGYIFKFSIAIAAFLAVIMIIWGGFEMMLSEAIPKIQDGKQKIYNALFGLIMVLASYLILSTIDPRLVEINTTIPPIKVCTSSGQANCIDTSEVTRFQSQLANDLNNLSTQTQAEINRRSEQIRSNEARINELYDYGDAITDTELIELRRLEEEVRGQRTDIRYIIGSQNGLQGFTRAYDIINNTNSTEQELDNLAQYVVAPIPNTLTNNRYPTNSPNIIQNQYNSEINRVLAQRDPAGIEIAQQLANQRDFYINQIREERELNVAVITERNTSRALADGPGYVATQRNRAYLNERLNEYNRELTNPTTINNTGISTDQYTRLLQTRVNSINTALRH